MGVWPFLPSLVSCRVGCAFCPATALSPSGASLHNMQESKSPAWLLCFELMLHQDIPLLWCVCLFILTLHALAGPLCSDCEHTWGSDASSPSCRACAENRGSASALLKACRKGQHKAYLWDHWPRRGIATLPRVASIPFAETNFIARTS